MLAGSRPWWTRALASCRSWRRCLASELATTGRNGSSCSGSRPPRRSSMASTSAANEAGKAVRGREYQLRRFGISSRCGGQPGTRATAWFQADLGPLDDLFRVIHEAGLEQRGLEAREHPVVDVPGGDALDREVMQQPRERVAQRPAGQPLVRAGPSPRRARTGTGRARARSRPAAARS